MDLETAQVEGALVEEVSVWTLSDVLWENGKVHAHVPRPLDQSTPSTSPAVLLDFQLTSAPKLHLLSI